MLVDPISSKKKQLNEWNPCKPLLSDILSMNLYRSWVVSKLLELQCNWKVQNHRQGLKKKQYTIYNFSPPKKNYFRIITFLNAWGLVTWTAVLRDRAMTERTRSSLFLADKYNFWRHLSSSVLWRNFFKKSREFFLYLKSFCNSSLLNLVLRLLMNKLSK